MIRRYAKSGGVLIPLNTMSSPILTGSDGLNLTTTTGVELAVTASATPNTKGSWVEYIAATSATAAYLEIAVSGTNVNGQDSSALIDIGTGAAGAETVLISDIAAGFKVAESPTQGMPETYLFPVNVAAGTRLSVRAQSVVASKVVTITIRPRRSSFDINSAGIVTMGANSSTSNGVTLASAATHTKAAWTEITASTSHAFQGLIMGVQLQAGGNTVGSTYMLLDIGVGATGAETTIIQNVLYATGSSETIQRRALTSLYEVDIPAGSRLVARNQRALNGGMGVILYGVR